MGQQQTTQAKKVYHKTAVLFSKNVSRVNFFFTQNTYHSLLKDRSCPCFYQQSQWIFRPRYLFRFLHIQSAVQVIRGIRGVQFRPVITEMSLTKKEKKKQGISIRRHDYKEAVTNFESVKCSLPPFNTCEEFWNVFTFLILKTGNNVDTIVLSSRV